LARRTGWEAIAKASIHAPRVGAIGHGGRTRATGAPGRSWLKKSRAERPCCQQVIFPEGELPDFDPYGVVWWALRTATSSVGHYEAGWALKTACGAAEDAGFSPDQLRQIAVRELMARARRLD
jgi:hypothetical protein